MDLSAAFAGLDLTDKQRIYVESRLRGMSKVASARAAGAIKDPERGAEQYEKYDAVRTAIERGRQISIQITGYTREKITDMLERAYYAATTAAEMVMAARELGKLHGLYAPTNVKVDHTHRLKDARTEEDLRRLSTEELLRLANERGTDFIEGEFTELEPLRLTDERQKARSG